MAASPLTRLRKLCLALPEAHEVEAWGEPTFRVRNKLFAMYASADNHHGNGRVAVWVKATPGNQAFMVEAGDRNELARLETAMPRVTAVRLTAEASQLSLRARPLLASRHAVLSHSVHHLR